jgi:hypothetical protein
VGDNTKLTRAEFEALEKVFTAEIFGYVHQRKAKIFKELEAAGMVTEHTDTWAGRFPVRVTGWILTHRGRMAYCRACA